MTEKQTLEFQANRIEMVLAQHKVPVRVRRGLVFPRWIHFQVPLATETQASKIEGLAEELAVALDLDTCRILRHRGMVVVKIPRLDPRPVQLLPLQHGLAQRSQVPPGTAVVGLSDNGAPLLVRLPSSHVAHLLIAGDSDNDRQALARTIIASLALRHRRRQLRLVLIDPTRRAFGSLAGLPHLLRPVSSETGETAQVLQSLVQWASARDNGHTKDPRIVVVISELADLLTTSGANGAARQALTHLAKHGYDAGIHLVACTREPDHPAMKELIQASFPVRLIGYEPPDSSTQAVTSHAGRGVARPRQAGNFIAVVGGRTIHFHAAHISALELAKLTGRALRTELDLHRPEAPSPARDQAARATPEQATSGCLDRLSHGGWVYWMLIKHWLGKLFRSSQQRGANRHGH